MESLDYAAGLNLIAKGFLYTAKRRLTLNGINNRVTARAIGRGGFEQTTRRMNWLSCLLALSWPDCL